MSYDITDRKLAEARNVLLGAVSDATRLATSAVEVVSLVAKVLLEHLNISSVFFGDLSKGRSRDPDLLQGWSSEGGEGVSRAVSLLWPDIDSLLSNGEHQYATTDGAVLRYTNMQNSLDIPSQSALLCLYAETDGVKGVFVAFRQAKGSSWSPEETSILKEISSIGWQSIEKHRRIDDLREVNVKQKRFLAILGHELRNPLSAAQSALDLMRISNAPQHTERAQKVLTQQFVQINRLMEDLVAISQMEKAGGLVLRPEPVDLQDLISAVVGALANDIKAKLHRVSTSFPAERVELKLDKVRTTQVFSNLLANAIKYTPKEGVIDISLTWQDADVEIRFRDNGIGMTPETLAATFDMFGRGQEALAQAQDGLGVGMWLAKGFVEAQGGTISAYSDGPGKGATVVVTLPSI